MTNDNIDKQPEEIDLAELVRSLWVRRRFILKVAGVVLALGLVAAIFGEVRYTTSVVVLPQVGKNASGGALMGLAAMAGINTGSAEQGELIPPTIYPTVLESSSFRKELMQSTVTVEGHDDPVTLFDYFTRDEYRRFSLLGTIGKYTVGLPGLLLKAIRGEDSDGPDAPSADGVETLTRDEFECSETLSKLVTISVDEKNGYVSLSATMPEALMSAEVASLTQTLLQEYVTRFKLEKVRANLAFIEERYRETKADFEAKQQALASYQDANRNVTSAVARIRENRLEDERSLAFSLYSELARRREQESIKVKEDTPVLTVIKPATVPMEKSAPNRALIVAASLLLGLCAGAGLALLLPWLKDILGSVRGNGKTEELL